MDMPFPPGSFYDHLIHPLTYFLLSGEFSIMFVLTGIIVLYNLHCTVWIWSNISQNDWPVLFVYMCKYGMCKIIWIEL